MSNYKKVVREGRKGTEKEMDYAISLLGEGKKKKNAYKDISFFPHLTFKHSLGRQIEKKNQSVADRDGQPTIRTNLSVYLSVNFSHPLKSIVSVKRLQHDVKLAPVIIQIH